MKTQTSPLRTHGVGALALAGILASLATVPRAQAQDANRHAVIVKAVEAPDSTRPSTRADAGWLGVSTEEASEALAAQLGLGPGLGLVVTFVESNSPAATAGLQRNDVLVAFDGQPLAVPAQLRRLVQSRKPGDGVRLSFYRSGKKETANAILAKADARTDFFDETAPSFRNSMRELEQQLRNLPIRDAIQEQMKAVREALGNAHIDYQKVQQEVQRSMTEARKAMEEALRNATNANSALGPLREALKELAQPGGALDTNATVTVRSGGGSVRSLVTTDDEGTLVIVCDPKPHLTAHDKAGKLLFDGEIATPEQRDQVPRDLWTRVEPLLKKLNPDTETQPEAEAAPNR